MSTPKTKPDFYIGISTQNPPTIISIGRTINGMEEIEVRLDKPDEDQLTIFKGKIDDIQTGEDFFKMADKIETELETYPENEYSSAQEPVEQLVAPVVEAAVAPVVEEPVAPVVEEPVAPVVEEPVAPVVEEQVEQSVEAPARVMTRQERMMNVKTNPLIQKPAEYIGLASILPEEQLVAPVVEEPVAPVVEEPVAPVVEEQVEQSVVAPARGMTRQERMMNVKTNRPLIQDPENNELIGLASLPGTEIKGFGKKTKRRRNKRRKTKRRKTKRSKSNRIK